jgi:membrane protein
MAPRKSLVWVARQLLTRWRQHPLTGSAAQLSFYFMLGLFPFLLFLVSLMAYLPIRPAVEMAFARLEAVMPPAALHLLETHVRELIERPRPHLVTLGMATALWSMSRGVDSVRQALNLANGVVEQRPFWRTQGASLLVSLCGVVLFLLGLPLIILGGRVGLWVADRAHVDSAYLTAWTWVRWPLTALLAMLAVALAYWALPDVKTRFKLITPGSVVSTALWLLATWALTQYSEHFRSYNAAYGSLAGVAFLLLWLYVSGIALLLGAELNAVLACTAEGPRLSQSSHA